jgi:geranylgeranyl transferase type-1 subunit beta
MSSVVQWLVSRQLAFVEEDEEEDEEFNPANPMANESGVAKQEDNPDDETIISLTKLSLHEPQSIAFNGRLNKPADTCYSWWGAASLEVCCSSTGPIRG